MTLGVVPVLAMRAEPMHPDPLPPNIQKSWLTASYSSAYASRPVGGEKFAGQRSWDSSCTQLSAPVSYCHTSFWDSAGPPPKSTARPLAALKAAPTQPRGPTVRVPRCVHVAVQLWPSEK